MGHYTWNAAPGTLQLEHRSKQTPNTPLLQNDSIRFVCQPYLPSLICANPFTMTYI